MENTDQMALLNQCNPGISSVQDSRTVGPIEQACVSTRSFVVMDASSTDEIICLTTLFNHSTNFIGESYHRVLLSFKYCKYCSSKRMEISFI